MNWSDIKRQIPSSPAFILDEGRVIDNLRPLQYLRQTTGCKILYSMKALPLMPLLELIRDAVDGFSASSLFEARLASEILRGRGSIHLTTPGLRAEEFSEVVELCSHVSFNSLPQYQRLHLSGNDYSKGLRINPKLSFADDIRYDPCRPHSKLGVAIDLVKDGFPSDIEGLHVHTVFARGDFLPLQNTLDKLLPIIELIPALKWLNLGGGYLYSKICDLEPLITVITELKRRYSLEIYLEPGKAVVDEAGYLLTTVLDRFDSDDKIVLVLDTSINHNPEVFEYQRRTPLQEHEPDAAWPALLVGSTCLAGDLFGEYRFQQPLEVGDRLVFSNVGAYSLIKANRFNGHNLPNIYSLRGGRICLLKNYDYQEYRQQWC